MKKRDIYEVLDSDGNLIGSDDKPLNDPNEITADGTTDHNAAIGHQHFAHDFLGRFGFYMYNEGEGDENAQETNELLNELAKLLFDHMVEITGKQPIDFNSLSDQAKERCYSGAKKIIALLNSKAPKKIEPNLSESELSKMIEDVITQKTDKSITQKSGDNDILDGKVKTKLKSLLNKLSDKDRNDLLSK